MRGEGCNITFEEFLPQMFNLSLVMRKQSDKSKAKSTQETWKLEKFQYHKREADITMLLYKGNKRAQSCKQSVITFWVKLPF